MNIEFYTKNDQFLLTSNCLYKNGEVIERGNISVYHLMMDEKAFLKLEQGEKYPPIFLSTDEVISMLPVDEYFQGKKCPKRTDYQVSFQALVQNEWIDCYRVISAVNEIHLRQIVKRKYGKEVRAIHATPQIAVKEALRERNQLWVG